MGCSFSEKVRRSKINRQLKDYLFPQYLDNHSFPPAAVEFHVEYLLPRTEVQLPFGDWKDHLVVDERPFKMGVAIGLARAMVSIISSRREPLQPFHDILLEA